MVAQSVMQAVAVRPEYLVLMDTGRVENILSLLGVSKCPSQSEGDAILRQHGKSNGDLGTPRATSSET